MQKVLLSTLFLFFLFQSFSQDFEVGNLKCENHTNPLGIEVLSPRFTWQFSTAKRGFIQSAYHILIADDSLQLLQNKATIWNSGKVCSSRSNMVSAGLLKLHAAKKYFWKIKAWDAQNQASAWSGIASFTSGLFAKEDWGRARWIGYEELPDSMIVNRGVYAPAKTLGEKAKQRPVVPLLRKEFSISKKLTSATAFISGLGQYELYINGQQTGQRFLAPGWTNYDKRVLYNVYDITNALYQGANAIGVILGNGFYNINRERYYKVALAYGYPKMICKIKLEFNDGTSAEIVSDESWKTVPSPISFTSIYGGEEYDAQLEQEGWSKANFKDESWKKVWPVKAPLGKMQAEQDYPVSVNESFEVKKITTPSQGVYVYDFGQNASGIVEIKLKGKKGQAVKLTPAELLNEKGFANQNATGKYFYTYTLKGDSVEIWRPRFSYYGFRYVQLEGGKPANASTGADNAIVLQLTKLYTGNSSPVAGSFSTSNELFNKINDLILWAIKSNLQSVVTDCPHREKLSWIEQDYLIGNSIKSNFDIHHLYRKLVYDMMDAQTEEGLVPNITPEYLFFDEEFGKKWGFGFRDSPEWGSASIILPWYLYKWYGDKQILEEAYPVMIKYIHYLKSKSEKNSLKYGLSDWYDLGPDRSGFSQLTPMGLTATAIYYFDLHLLSTIAKELNKKTEAKEYFNRAAMVKQAFSQQFFDAKKGVYGSGSQTSMAMPLAVGLVEEKNRQPVFQKLIDSLCQNNKRLTAGDIGYHFLIRALQEGGASQLLYEMNARDDVPGYGYQIKQGATALTESWTASPLVSNNHLMLGPLMEWFYTGLAGIQQAENSIAYKDVVIKPEVVGDLSFVKGSYESVYGTIKSEWEKTAEKFLLHVQVPPNATATIYLPAKQNQKIFEGASLLAKQKNIKLLAFKEGRAIVKIGSGNYYFTVQ